MIDRTLHRTDPFAPPVNAALTPTELTLLYRMYTGQYGDGRAVLYSNPDRRSPSQRRLYALHHLGLITFFDATAGGWERGMWGARLTCLGTNTVFRHDGKVRLNAAGEKDLNATGPNTLTLDGHPGCPGGWRPDGTCTDCTQQRPLDRTAYEAYLSTLTGDNRRQQTNGPQLYCIEHGWMRHRDITTTKVCRQPGTDFHDGGLIRA